MKIPIKCTHIHIYGKKLPPISFDIGMWLEQCDWNKLQWHCAPSAKNKFVHFSKFFLQRSSFAWTMMITQDIILLSWVWIFLVSSSLILVSEIWSVVAYFSLQSINVDVVCEQFSIRIKAHSPNPQIITQIIVKILWMVSNWEHFVLPPHPPRTY